MVSSVQSSLVPLTCSSGFLPFEEYNTPPYRNPFMTKIPSSQASDPAFRADAARNGWELRESIDPASGEKATELIRYNIDKSAFLKAIDEADLRPTFDAASAPFLVGLATRCWHRSPSKRPSMIQVVAELEQECERLGLNINALKMKYRDVRRAGRTLMRARQAPEVLLPSKDLSLVSIIRLTHHGSPRPLEILPDLSQLSPRLT